MRQELAVARLVELPIEVDRALGEQRPQDGERLLEARDPVVERRAQRRELGLVPARAEAQHQAPARDLVDGRRLLREHERVVERRGGNEGADRDAAQRRGGRPAPTPGPASAPELSSE